MLTLSICGKGGLSRLMKVAIHGGGVSYTRRMVGVHGANSSSDGQGNEGRGDNMRRHLAFTSMALALGAVLAASGQVKDDTPMRPARLSAGGMPVPDAIAFATATTGCVSGGDRIACTTDGGRSWSTRYRHVTVGQLAFVTPAVGWAVAPSLLLATANGGRT